MNFFKRKPIDETLQAKLDVLEDKVSKIKNTIASKEEQLNTLRKEISDSESELEFTNELQLMGFYEPKFNFTSSLEYKNRLFEVRQREKDAVKNKTAAISTQVMTYNNSVSKGRAMQNQIIKAAIRGFNGESDGIISKVTASNIETKRQQLIRSFDTLNKIYIRNFIVITSDYFNLKEQELTLAAEYELKKQEEQEILRDQREQEREDKKLEAEIRTQRLKLTKDKKHHLNMVSDLESKILSADPNEVQKIKDQIALYNAKIVEISEKEVDIDYREQHATAGYVYIISNIGAFGENVFKIGVTRRLKPEERINELGSASVPFKFDTHALIFSEDAFALETELHNTFSNHKINKLNGRKEFFKVSIEEIKLEIEKHPDLLANFVENADAFEYRQSNII